MMGESAGLGRKRKITIDVKVEMLQSIVVPIVLYGSELGMLNVIERRKVEASVIKCLRKVLKGRLMQRVMSKDIRERCRNKDSLSERLAQRTLRVMWKGKVTKKIYMAEVNKFRRRGWGD